MNQNIVYNGKKCPPTHKDVRENLCFSVNGNSVFRGGYCSKCGYFYHGKYIGNLSEKQTLQKIVGMGLFYQGDKDVISLEYKKIKKDLSATIKCLFSKRISNKKRESVFGISFW